MLMIVGSNFSLVGSGLHSIVATSNGSQHVGAAMHCWRSS